MARRIDLNLLAALDALISERSVSGAARRVGLGQPAMSAALSRLRGLLDDPVLVRGARGMEPTPRALEVAGPLREALDALRAVVEARDAFDPATSARTFRLSGGDYAGMALLPGLLARLRERAPGANLRFRFVEKGQVFAALDAGEVDLALVVLGEVPARFERQVVLVDRFVCLVAGDHPWADRPLTPLCYARSNHVLVTERGDERGALDEVLEAQGLSRRIVATVPSVALVPHLLAGTDLLATVGRRAAELACRSGELRTLDLPFAVAPWEVNLVSRRRDAGDPGLAWLRGTLIDLGRAAEA